MKPRYPTLMALASLLASIVPPAALGSEPMESEPDPPAVLTELLPDDAYGAGDSCLLMRKVGQVDVLDENHLLFWGRKDEAWINRLSVRCRGLRENALLAFEQHGSSVCRNDWVNAHERGAMIGQDFPARCRLGDFAPLDPQQAAMVRKQFRHLRDSRRRARKDQASP
ncbi:MAG: hypothetical protein H6994_05155 [Pseudomonadales bacterium]|nr:hypothetical protein [Pseudomonadales bacterium]